MYKARTHLGITSGWFWSSSQGNDVGAWCHRFTNDGIQNNIEKWSGIVVRAVRAF